MLLQEQLFISWRVFLRLFDPSFKQKRRRPHPPGIPGAHGLHPEDQPPRQQREQLAIAQSVPGSSGQGAGLRGQGGLDEARVGVGLGRDMSASVWDLGRPEDTRRTICRRHGSSSEEVQRQNREGQRSSWMDPHGSDCLKFHLDLLQNRFSKAEPDSNRSGSVLVKPCDVLRCSGNVSGFLHLGRM